MSRSRPVREVPDLGGLSVTAAENAVLDAGLLPKRVLPGQDHACTERRDGAIVCGQEPRPHTRIAAGGSVCFWCAPPEEDDPPDGGGGSWLPRGPRPLSPTGSKPF
jgi:beta-lactam-binding protein with PASTA domain